jgi:hypothetical protein
MASRRGLPLLLAVGALAAALWMRSAPTAAPPTPPPPPVETAPDPEPVVEEPPEPPPRAELPAEMVDRIIAALAAALAQPPDTAEATVTALFDVRSVTRDVIGRAWDILSAEQRAAAVRDFGRILADSILRGARAWLPRGPWVAAVKDEGATARVTTRADDEIEVRFVLSRRSDPRETASPMLADVEVDGASVVATYRRQAERRLAEGQGAPTVLLERIARRAAKVRGRRAMEKAAGGGIE